MKGSSAHNLGLKGFRTDREPNEGSVQIQTKFLKRSLLLSSSRYRLRGSRGQIEECSPVTNPCTVVLPRFTKLASVQRSRTALGCRCKNRIHRWQLDKDGLPSKCCGNAFISRRIPHRNNPQSRRRHREASSVRGYNRIALRLTQAAMPSSETRGLAKLRNNGRQQRASDRDGDQRPMRSSLPSTAKARATAAALPPKTAKATDSGSPCPRNAGFQTKANGKKKPTTANRTAWNAIKNGSSSAIVAAAKAATAIGGVRADSTAK